jgi:hypothetical protein
MASSNPFRKKSPQGIERFPPIEAIDTSGAFAHHDPRAPASPAAAADARQRAGTGDSTASKTVKKVRIISPPPLSPDSPEWSATVGLNAPSHSSSFSPSWTTDRRFQSDPFTTTAAASAEDSNRSSAAAPPSSFHSHGSTEALPAGQLSPNPLGKTLQDLEDARLDAELQKERRDEGAALKIGNAVRKSLNVDSFHRLLMTGSADYSGPPSSDSSAMGDAVLTRGASAAEPSLPNLEDAGLLASDPSHRPPYLSDRDDISISARGHGDEDESSMSDSSVNLHVESRSARARKPAPPPPSSRHGKSLKFELKDDASVSPPSSTKSPPSDVNKPLPQPPARNESRDDIESPFDQEAAGKVPELEPLQSPVPQKKSIPAPPPRRGLSRSESKLQHSTSTNVPPVAPSKTEDEDASTGGVRSRSSSFRQGPPAPAPPPPRRVHGVAGSRQTSGTGPTISPGIGQAAVSPPPSSAVQDDMEESEQTSTPPEPGRGDVSVAASVKVAAPPPPPTRNASIRRPPSVHSVDSGVRHIAFEMKPRDNVAPPPPAPRRQRGSSRSSVEGPPGHVGDVPSRPRATFVQDGAISTEPTLSSGKGVDILADLTALQREVDALRGKMN